MQNPYSADQYPDLSLAMTPDTLSGGPVIASGSANNQTFAAPSTTVPTNRPYDLQAPGIDHIPAMHPDPYTGDLLQFDHPHGLSLFAINQPDPLALPPDPMLPDFADYDQPDNLIMPSPMSVDPSLPNLQSPDLEQEVHMQDRPGEMVDSNGDSPNLGPDGDNDDDDGPMPPYDEAYQTPGLSHRQRKQDMLYRGLMGDL